MKYLVMECHLSYAVALDEQGRFLKVANQHFEVGQTVTEVIPMQESSDPNTGIMKKASGSAAAFFTAMVGFAACLVLCFTFLFNRPITPYASVYMTINPEVRIDVTKDNEVIGLEGMNEDGKHLIQDYSYKNKMLDPVMDELIDRAIDMGYLSSGAQITLSFDAQDNEWVMITGQNLGTHLKEYLTEKISVEIEIVKPDAPETPVSPSPSDAPVFSTEIVPGESDYNQSNYTESDYGPAPDANTDATSENKHTTETGIDTDYQESDDGLTDYIPPANTNDSGYGVSTETSGNSGYEAPVENSGDSGYDAPAETDNDSGYTSSNDESDSGYESSDDSDDD